MATQPRPGCSFNLYLELERSAEYRSEYRDGEIIAMSGGTRAHSRLSARMIALLTRTSNCEVFDSNMRLYIELYNECTYPDAMLICDPVQFWRDQDDVVVNPSVVVEVLSPSTQKYDRTTKSVYYRSIPSLRHIVLVSADSIAVEWSTRQDESTWTIKQFVGEANLPLGFEMGDVYQGIL